MRPEVLPCLSIPGRRATDLEIAERVKVQKWHLNAIILHGSHQRVTVHGRLALIELIVALEHTGESLLH